MCWLFEVHRNDWSGCTSSSDGSLSGTQTGHSRCRSSLGIFRPIELGSSRSTASDFFGVEALEQQTVVSNCLSSKPHAWC